MDKEYSDITYIPTNTIGMQIAELCKRNHQYRNPEDALHNRPYYDRDQMVKQFDESAQGQISRESNPELLAKLQAEMDERKKKEQLETEERKLREQAAQKHLMDEKVRSVSVDHAALNAIRNNNSSSGSGQKSNSGGDGSGMMFAIGAVLGGGALYTYSNGQN